MIEVRKTLLAPFCESTVRMARQMYNHCPDCGGHTRIMVIRGVPNEEATVVGPPPAEIFFCERCAVALLVVFDPTHEVAIERGLPQMFQTAGLLPSETPTSSQASPPV